MIVSRFLKPKWQRANPETRKQAVNALTDQVILSEVGRNDPDPIVRRMACKKIRDLDVLAAVVDSDGDAGVREFASARQRRLLCGVEPDSPPLEKRLAHLAGGHSARLAEQVAAQGKEPQLRLKAVQSVDDVNLLSEIASKDGSAPVRLAAAQRIGDKGTLEGVLRMVRKKDKGVYRLVRAKLREIAAREQAPARVRGQCEGFCERLEKLGRGHNWVQDKAVLDHVDKQWNALDAQAEQRLAERYQAARRRFLESYRTYRAQNLTRLQEQEHRAALKRSKQALLDDLHAALSSNAETALKEVFERIVPRWERLEKPSEPDSEDTRLAADFADSLSQIRNRLERIGRQHARQTRLAELTREIEDLIAARTVLQVASSEALAGEARDIVDALGQVDEAKRLRQSLAKLAARLHKQREQATVKGDGLAPAVQALEQALENGELKTATSLYQKLDADIELIEASAVPQQRVGPVKKTLRALLPRVRELQNWRKWGADQHKESLCHSMEALLEADLGLEQLSYRLRELQTEWKEFDKGGGPGNRALWDRFHTAADQVYDRCGPYFERQTQQRETNRTQREALCTELEGFLEKIDWTGVDWKRAVRAEREMRNAWSGLGPVPSKVRRELDKRFHKALRVLNKHLADERTRNQAHKQRLIAGALALREEPDLDKALQEVKQLQRQWHTTVAGKRRHENRIWQEFRAACDQVFARRHQIEETRRATCEANQKIRQAVCEALESLVESTSGSGGARELQQRFQALETRWSDAAELEVPQSAIRGLSRRWERAVRQYHECLQAFRHVHGREQLEHLHRRAVLCGELEGYLGQVEEGQSMLRDIQSRWEGLPVLANAALRDRIERRYHGAYDALAQQGDLLEMQLKGMAENREKRENLCLRMEILAGMESPPEAAQQRLAVQVDRLSEHLREGEDDLHREAMELESEWYLTGPAAKAVGVLLEQRFMSALQAMRKDQTDSALTGGRSEATVVGSPASPGSEEQTLHQAR